MTSRSWIACVLFLLAMTLVSILAVAPKVVTSRQAQTTAVASANRQEIKQMPILERPHRFGHFYGNTVRRRAGQ